MSTGERYLIDLARRLRLPLAEELQGVPADPFLDRALGPYRVKRLVARGGMGAVYEAERSDGAFERRVAIKLLPLAIVSDEAKRRFLLERRILARLEHPNIARLLDAGVTEEGIPYFVLEFVEGTPLDEHCRKLELRLRERIELFCQVCQAVGEAHRQGIVHRDIKPSNVLVDASGRAKLLDFGIAKVLEPAVNDPDTPFTRPGARPLTPAYASPEQLGDLPVSPASDVYSLARLLEEVIRGGDPKGDELDSGVERVLRRALDQSPARRYPTGRALEADLRHLLAGTPPARSAAHAEDTAPGRFHVAARVRIRTLVQGAVAAPKLVRNPAGAVAGAAVLLVIAIFLTGGRSLPAGPVVLVASESSASVQALGPPVADLLTASLRRIPDLEVIDGSRIFANVVAPPGSPTGAAALRQAAVAAGARELIVADVDRTTAGALRLTLQAVSLPEGTLRAGLVVEAEDPIGLVDAATARLGGRWGRSVRGSVAEVTTASFEAYREYQEGLRAFYMGEHPRAHDFFRRALDRDSTFAMASYYASRTSRDFHASLDHLARAVRASAGAPESQRLFIQAAWADLLDDPVAAALADSLVEIAPRDPHARIQLGRRLMWGGDFLASVPHFRRAIELDATSLTGSDPQCRACEAYGHLATAYELADSMPAAERVTRELVSQRPGSAVPLYRLASVLAYQGRFKEALAAANTALPLQWGTATELEVFSTIHVMAGDFEAAERLLRGDGADVVWRRITSLRYQGRMREALAAARQHRRITEGEGDPAHPIAVMPEAQVLFDMGRYQEAARLFDSLAATPVESRSRSHTARHRIWMLTHVATARAAVGDTVGFPELVAELERLGPLSAYGRDQKLHHYARGLLLAVRGDTTAAIRELRSGVFSWTLGFSRLNLTLARLLIAADSAEAAIPVLQSALRGFLEASNMYATRTELHMELGRAFEVVGQADSALVHYRKTASAWERADEAFRPLRTTLATRIRRLESVNSPRHLPTNPLLPSSSPAPAPSRRPSWRRTAPGHRRTR